MNIGIVSTWFDRGAAFVSKQFADVLSSENNVFIFARGGEKYDRESSHWQKYPVVWGRRYRKSETQINWWQFRKWILKNKIEIVIFNEQKDWEIVVDAKRLGVKTVAYVDYYTQQTVPFFGLYDGVICNTKRHYDVFKWHPGAFYIPWGTDTEKFKPKTDDVDNFDDIVFFHSAGMGGINLRKGTDILVSAFNKISLKSRLIIHSQVPLEAYGAVADKIKSNQSIEFIVDSVPPPGLYHLGNVYVYPSRLDGIGLTVCEALSMRMPVITTNCAPMNEFVNDGVNGWLIKVKKYISRPDGYYWPESICDTQDLVAIMEKCIKDKSLVQKCALNARASAIGSFDWNKNAVALSDIMTEVLTKPINLDHQLANKSLGFSFEQRETVRPTYLKFFRKLRRWFESVLS